MHAASKLLVWMDEGVNLGCACIFGAVSLTPDSGRPVELGCPCGAALTVAACPVPIFAKQNPSFSHFGKVKGSLVFSNIKKIQISIWTYEWNSRSF